MTRIYFPDLHAEAEADVRRGGTASVCYAYDGHAYIGRMARQRFTTVKPKWWRERDVTLLHHIPSGGFCFRDLRGSEGNEKTEHQENAGSM